MINFIKRFFRNNKKINSEKLFFCFIIDPKDLSPDIDIYTEHYLKLYKYTSDLKVLTTYGLFDLMDPTNNTRYKDLVYINCFKPEEIYNCKIAIIIEHFPMMFKFSSNVISFNEISFINQTLSTNLQALMHN